MLVPQGRTFAEHGPLSRNVGRKIAAVRGGTVGQLECAKVLVDGGADHLFESELGGCMDNCLDTITPSMEVFQYFWITSSFSSQLLGGALLHAASQVDPSFVSLLLAVGANPNFDSGDGATPLIYAVQRAERRMRCPGCQGAKTDLKIPLQKITSFRA